MSYFDDAAPKAVIIDGKIINHEQLKRYWTDANRRLCILRRVLFQDDSEFTLTPNRNEFTLTPSKPEPRRLDIERLQSHLMHTENKLNEHIDHSRRRRGEY